MSYIEHYKNQYRWRSWETVYDLLPDMHGQTVLDLGCGVGDQAADFIAQGAYVIGVDMSEAMLREARSKCPENARFIQCDFQNLPDLGVKADGIWCSFAAAYSIDFIPVLTSLKKHIKKSGWLALTEIDNLFGHEPLNEEVKRMFEKYSSQAYNAGWYDFYMGRKLKGYLKKSGYKILNTVILEDREFSFSGPAEEGVIHSWQARFDRMPHLKESCGDRFGDLRKEFLSCLTEEEHQSLCKVYSCIATS